MSAANESQMTQLSQCMPVFREIGDALNAQVSSKRLLEIASKALVESFDVQGCQFRLLSRDQLTLDDIASYGLSRRFLDKGPVGAERSVAQGMDGEVVLVEDCWNDPRIQYPAEFRAEGIASMLTVPLVTHGQVMGVIRLFSARRREFSAVEIEVFQLVALYCTSAVVTSMYRQIIEQVMTSIRGTLDIDEVLQSIVRVVAEDLRAKGCTIHLVDSASKALELRAAYGLSQIFLDTAVQTESCGAVQEAMKGNCVAIIDGAVDPQIKNHRAIGLEKIASLLFVPLISRAQTIGIMTIYTHRPYRFSTQEQVLMSSVGEQCSLAIRNAQMYEAVKKRYDQVVDDFQMWFEHTHASPG